MLIFGKTKHYLNVCIQVNAELMSEVAKLSQVLEQERSKYRDFAKDPKKYELYLNKCKYNLFLRP